MSGLVLVTGGTGKTGRRVAAQLRERGVACRVGARAVVSGEGAQRFDWTDSATWDNALKSVSAIYLVAPPIAGDPAPMMIDFIQRARERGITRFVLLSSSLLPAGGPAMGTVHLWLQENVAEWAVLRPSWFMQNFSEGQHLATIRDEDSIYSATEDGRVPFVSADDIAASAVAALTCTSSFNTDFVLTSDRAITYDEVAERISRAIGRTISHRRLSAEALAERHRVRGMGQIFAQTLAAMDAAIAAGAEDRVTGCVEYLAGRSPITFDAFVEANMALW
jgi:ergot alkaloid biosynthesis protein